MQVLKTWLSIVGLFALVFLSLACLQLRHSLAGKDAEIARLRAASRPTTADDRPTLAAEAVRAETSALAAGAPAFSRAADGGAPSA